jgi:Zn-finger nucleic acid-binding protein
MKCPRCETAVLDERERSGMTIDVCTSCRGVWLDRGELEKLLAHAKRELEEERSYYEVARPSSAGAPLREQAAPPRDYDRERPRDYDREPPSSSRRHEYGPDGQRRHYKKRGWLDSLGEIFD